MGMEILKDIKDIKDREYVRIRTLEDLLGDPDPRRRFEWRLVELASHIEAIEEFLGGGDLAAGKAFVRPQERPAVDNDALHQGMQAIEQRLQRIESSLAERGSVRQAAKG